MPQTPVSASAFLNSATPITLYTVPAGKTAIINSIQGASLLGSTFQMTINKVSATGTVYPIVVNRISGDDINFWATTGGQSPNNTTAPMNGIKGSLTLAEGESITLSTNTGAAFKFPSYYTGNGIVNEAIYANGRYVVVGLNADTSRGLVVTSTNGTTWTQQNFTAFRNLISVAGNGATKLIAVSQQVSNGYFVSNDNGVTWTQESNLTGGHSGAPSVVEFVNNLWFIMGGNFIYTSSDGTTWTRNSAITTFLNGLSPSFRDVIYDGTRYIFGCATGTAIHSTDLVTFTRPGNIRQEFPYTGVYNTSDAKFYVTHYTSAPSTMMASSSDGINWSPVTGAVALPNNYDAGWLMHNGGTTAPALANFCPYDLYRFIYSTNNGASWTAYTQTNWPSGSIDKVFGLGNGYFLITSIATYACYPYTNRVWLTATPWTSAASGTVGRSGDTMVLASAASNGVQNGHYVVFYYDSADPYRIRYTFNATGTSFSTTLTTTSYYEVPQQTVFMNGQYYMIGSSRGIYKLDPATPGTLVNVGTAPSGAVGLGVVNNRLVTHLGSGIIAFSTDGATWVQTPINNWGISDGYHTARGIFTNGPSASFMVNGYGQVGLSSDGENWNSYVTNPVKTYYLNNKRIVQNQTSLALGTGTYEITNPTSITGWLKLTTTGTADFGPNTATYANGSYFFTPTTQPALMSSIPGTYAAAGVSGTQLNGEVYVGSPSTRYATASSGTGAIVVNGRASSGSFSIGYVPNVNNARSVAAIAASILEIS